MVRGRYTKGADVLAEDEGTSEPALGSKKDGYLGTAVVGGTARLYFVAEGAMYYVDGTVTATPAVGNPYGLLLALTYPA